MIKAAVLGSPIAHSLSPLLHTSAYEILGIEGDYSAIEVPSPTLVPFLDRSLDEGWTGFNLTMPLKESVFDSGIVTFDESSSKIRSANTLVRTGDRYLATSTDASAFTRLLRDIPVDHTAIIGGGGTARAAIGAISERAKTIDLFLRTPGRADIAQVIAPKVQFEVKSMSSSLEGYDLVINTTPAGSADHFASGLRETSGLYFECLYQPWPTELSFAWKELGGATLNGIDLLVEQALDAIALLTGETFDYGELRERLLTVATERVSTQSAD
jgi:shikimate dehydrogenase